MFVTLYAVYLFNAGALVCKTAQTRLPMCLRSLQCRIRPTRTGQNRVEPFSRRRQSLLKQFHNIYQTRTLTIVPTKNFHWPLSCAGRIQSIPSHLYLGLPSSLFLYGFPTKMLCSFILIPIRTTCPANLIQLKHSNCTLLRIEVMKSSLSSFFNLPQFIPLREPSNSAGTPNKILNPCYIE